MKKLTTAAFLLVFLSGGAPAADSSQKSDEPTKTELYQVTDLLAEKTVALELWTYRKVPDFDRHGHQREEPADQIRREVFGQKQPANTETRKYWWNEFRTANEETYFREEFSLNVIDLGKEQRMFGSIEQRRTADDALLLSWPVFMSIRKDDPGSVTITETSYMPKGVIAVTMKICDASKENCFFPLRQGEALYAGGKLVRFLMYTQKK